MRLETKHESPPDAGGLSFLLSHFRTLARAVLQLGAADLTVPGMRLVDGAALLAQQRLRARPRLADAGAAGVLPPGCAGAASGAAARRRRAADGAVQLLQERQVVRAQVRRRGGRGGACRAWTARSRGESPVPRRRSAASTRAPASSIPSSQGRSSSTSPALVSVANSPPNGSHSSTEAASAAHARVGRRRLHRGIRVARGRLGLRLVRQVRLELLLGGEHRRLPLLRPAPPAPRARGPRRRTRAPRARRDSGSGGGVSYAGAASAGLAAGSGGRRRGGRFGAGDVGGQLLQVLHLGTGAGHGIVRVRHAALQAGTRLVPRRPGPARRSGGAGSARPARPRRGRAAPRPPPARRESGPGPPRSRRGARPGPRSRGAGGPRSRRVRARPRGCWPADPPRPAGRSSR